MNRTHLLDRPGGYVTDGGMETDLIFHHGVDSAAVRRLSVARRSGRTTAAAGLLRRLRPDRRRGHGRAAGRRGGRRLGRVRRDLERLAARRLHGRWRTLSPPPLRLLEDDDDFLVVVFFDEDFLVVVFFGAEPAFGLAHCTGAGGVAMYVPAFPGVGMSGITIRNGAIIGYLLSDQAGTSTIVPVYSQS